LIDVVPHMTPWHFVVCGTHAGSDDMAQRARTRIAQWIPVVDTEVISEVVPVPENLARGVDTERPPTYVMDLIEGVRPELPLELGAVLVIRENSLAA
jgi:hypothetical protein